MATVPAARQVSVEEYLHTTYRPDCDYIDGAIVERNLGQHDHARLQGLILLHLMLHERQWNIHVLPEQRLKILDRRYRVPDIMVLPAEANYPPVIVQAPLLCIEIVSPDDRLKDLTDRAEDYRTLGVPETWIFDPQTKRAFTYSERGLHEVPPDAIMRSGAVELDVAELFAQLY
jgi:Uma2 family endonuclease